MPDPFRDFAPLVLAAHRLTRDIDIGILMVERKYAEVQQRLTEAAQLLSAAAEVMKYHVMLQQKETKDETK